MHTLERFETKLRTPTANGLVGVTSAGVRYYRSDPSGVTYNIDDVLTANPGYSDGQAIQYCLDRVKTDDLGNARAVPVSITITGSRLYDVTSLSYQDTGTANAQLLVPAIGAIATKPFVTITFRGPVRPAKSYSVVDTGNTNVLSVDGFIIKSTKTASGTTPCMIGVSQAEAGYGTGLNFSLVHLIFENVTLRTSDAAPITALDARHAIMITCNGVSVDTGTTSNAISEPTGGGMGIRSPQELNASWNDYTEVFVQGYKVGIEVTENTHIASAYINYCESGLRFIAATHASWIGRVLLQWNKYHVEFSGGIHNMTIEQLDFEGYNTGLGTQWYKTVNVVKDPSNYGVGFIRFACMVWTSTAQVSYLTAGVVVDGGAYLTVTRHQPWKQRGDKRDVITGNAITSYADGNGSTIYYQNPSANGDNSKFYFWCVQGIYRLSFAGQVGPDGGIVDIKCTDSNGTRTIVSQHDFYAAAYNFTKCSSYDFYVRVTGLQEIKFEVTGKHASSTAYMVQLSHAQVMLTAGD